MKPLIFFVLVLSAASPSIAQRGIRLNSRYSKREKFIADGSRVYYEYANVNHPINVVYSRYGPRYFGIRGVGIMKIVNDSTIAVDQEQIKVKELMRIGARKKGAGIGSAILVVGGFAMTMGSVSHDQDGQQHVDPFLITVGLTCEVAGLIDAIHRYPKSSSTWRIEVANAPTSSVH
jgi:hypothetical protein